MQEIDELPESFQTLVQPHWLRLCEHPEFATSKLDSLLAGDSKFRAELVKVWIASDFVAQATVTNPGLLLHLHGRRALPAPDYGTELADLLAPLESSNFKGSVDLLKCSLRHYFRQEFVSIIWRDVCGIVDMFSICQQMTDLADACLQNSLSVLHKWSVAEWGQPIAEGKTQSLVVIGMGKLGAFELNVSSDIDLIFAYPEPGTVESPTEEKQRWDVLTNQQFFTRLGQRLIDVLDTPTADGFVFRVDMRLRPYGEEGALVLSFDAMEDYYQNQGRDWERYAMVKARIVAGDQQRGALLLKRLQPFVYRKYLDFAMFESLRDMKSQINKQAKTRKLGTDIKLGSGGIREVEFTVQALQLVHGGRDRLLQQPSLKKTLAALVAGGYLPQAIADDLLDAYVFLRNLEHKLQALANQQTQRLPEQPALQARIAFAMDHKDWPALLATLATKRDIVAGHFRDVLGTAEEATELTEVTRDWIPIWKMELPESEAREFLAREGYDDAVASLELLKAFRLDRKFLALAANSRERLNAFMPVLLDAVADSSSPSLCLSRVMPLVEAVYRRTAYLVLLMENPVALRQLVEYCTASPFISDTLARYPVLLDELLHVLDTPPERAALADEIRTQLLRIEADNFEEQLECLRYFKQSHQLQVAAAEVAGKMPLMKVSDYLTFTAEVILDSVLSICWHHLVTRHGYPVHVDGSYGEPDFAIVGYGKLGGIELSYNSDLDLVFLHRADLEKDTVTTDAQRRINSREFYIKLAQRIIMMLGTYTMSGKLYEVDMRLRPSGSSGLLVSSLESFTDYQANTAWTWEHQALVRARGVAGSRQLIEAFLEVRAQILTEPREVHALAGEVVSMRERMRKELSTGSSSPLEKAAFALKQGAGGIVDIEFLVQFLVLGYSHQCAGLFTYTDNYRILEAACECELLDNKDMQALIDAYLALRAFSHQLALQQIESLDALRTLETCQNTVISIWNNSIASMIRD